MNAVMVADQAEPAVFEALNEPLIHHRPVEDILRGVADWCLLRCDDKPLEKFVVDALVNDDRAKRSASLARRPKAAKERALNGEIQISIVHDYQGVLAA